MPRVVTLVIIKQLITHINKTDWTAGYDPSVRSKILTNLPTVRIDGQMGLPKTLKMECYSTGRTKHLHNLSGAHAHAAA